MSEPAAAKEDLARMVQAFGLKEEFAGIEGATDGCALKRSASLFKRKKTGVAGGKQKAEKKEILEFPGKNSPVYLPVFFPPGKDQPT